MTGEFTVSFRRILLTGGSGFVGGYLAPALTAAFPQAEKLLICRPGHASSGAGFATAEAQIYDRDAVGNIVQRFNPDLVVHLAAQSSVGHSEQSAEETWRVNFDGSFALASACARAAPSSTFFFVSSAEVYGLSFRQGPVSEDAPLRPQNPYARSKAATEFMLTDVLPADTQLIVVRPFNHTGPGQDERFVLASFAAQIARMEAGRVPPKLSVGNLDVERDFLDVRDVCDAYLRLIQHAPALAKRDVFNVSSATAHSIRSLLQVMRSRSPVEFDVVVDSTRLRSTDIPCAVGSNEHISSKVGWKPTRRIEDTLGDLLSEARKTFVRQ